MSKKAAIQRPARKPARGGPGGVIHPVVIFPFQPPEDTSDVQELYRWLGGLGSQGAAYRRPLTVIDRKTHYSRAEDRSFLDFRANSVERVSDVLDAWCVDTCQMWYTGLGAAYERGRPGDVYWLIPGDFDYGTALGREVLSRLHDLPEIVLELGQDLCVGEIATDHRHPKQIIDTYGTFALLYNWFPDPAREIRETTERPRSEFFAVGHEFLGRMLTQRWFAYEQTLVMLLRAVLEGRRISRFFVGQITDLPEGREPLPAAIQQVERTERVLRTVWRESHSGEPDWLARYRALDAQSEQVRRSALVVLEKLLR